ncbi:helix-turn-helix transcriptional regulator [Streptomyces sp. NPDC046985]|uniref:helix-turn-helix domain-containing protein n=1 Tax=Streptomyces sp. NPDC046985 TaxID=3155377 RepID=UPI003406A5B0
MRQSNRACAKCHTELSRYNPDALCSVCSKTAAAPGVPDRAWRDEAVQRALVAWDFGEVLRLVRKRSGLSQMAVRELTALPQSFISALERGQKQIGSPDTLLDLLRGLGLPSDLQSLLLVTLGGEPAIPIQVDSSDPALPWTMDRMVRSLEAATGGTTMKRRHVLAALSGAALTQYVLQSAIAPVEPFVASAGNTAVSASLIDSLQTTTDALRQADATNGSGNLAQTAKAHLRMILHLLKHGSHSEQHGRRLAAVAADTTSQAGWFTFDSGDHEAAQRLFLSALRAAHASGDARLRAGALGFLAIHAYSTGDPRDAITATRTARQVVIGHDAPALHAMLLTRQARGHARLGEERGALAALSEAEELCSRGRGEDDPHWLYWVNAGEILGQTGSCYLDLDQPVRAAECFTAARGVLNREETRTTAQFLSRAATAQMRAGESDAGCATAHEVLDIVEGVQSARLDDHLFKMLREAATFESSPFAEELLDRGKVVMRKRRNE